MKNLLALLMYHTHNIHILHWKIAGIGFQSNHEYLDGLYQEMNGQIDLIAEMMLQRNEDPITYQEMLEISKDREWKTIQPNQYYDEVAAFSHVQEMFEDISNNIERLYQDDSISKAHIAELETMQSWYTLRAGYLFKNRLTLFTKIVTDPKLAEADESLITKDLFSQLTDLINTEK